MRSLIWILLLSSTYSFAQELDSINAWRFKANTSRQVRTKILLYNKITDEFKFHNSDSALVYANEAVRMAELFRNDTLEGQAKMRLGNVLNAKSRPKDALEQFYEAEGIAKSIGDERMLASIKNNIGISFYRLENFSQTLKYYNECAQHLANVNDSNAVATVLNNIGGLYLKMDSLERGKEYFEQALGIAERMGNQQSVAIFLSGLGAANTALDGKSRVGLNQLKRSLQLKQDLGMPQRSIIYSLTALGQSYDAFGSPDSAVFPIRSGLRFAKEKNYPNLVMSCYELMSVTYERLGDIDSALYYHKLFQGYGDSLYDLNIASQMAEMEAKHRTTEAEAENAKLKAEQEISRVYEEQLQQRIIYVSAGAGLVLLLLIFVFNRMRVINNQKKVIEEQKLLVDSKNKDILESITYAKRIQNSILPEESMMNKALGSHFVLYLPKDIVAGDFYWVHPAGDEVLFAVADCTGHGVPGAMVSVVCHNALERAVNEFGLTKPNEVLNKVCHIVIDHFEKAQEFVRDGMDIALCVLNRKEGKLYYAGAHSGLYMVSDNEVIRMRGDKRPIGRSELPIDFTTHTIDVKKGDRIYLHTDGIVDQFGGPRGKKFQHKRFKELLLNQQIETLSKQNAALLAGLQTWQGELEQIDDICVMGVEV